MDRFVTILYYVMPSYPVSIQLPCSLIKRENCCSSINECFPLVFKQFLDWWSPTRRISSKKQELIRRLSLFYSTCRALQTIEPIYIRHAGILQHSFLLKSSSFDRDMSGRWSDHFNKQILGHFCAFLNPSVKRMVNLFFMIR